MKRPSRTAKAARPVVGLDLQPSFVAAAQVDASAGLHLERTAFAPLEPHVLRDGEVADVDGLIAALTELFAQSKLDRRVRVGIANQRIVVRTLDLPPLDDPRSLEAAVRFTAADELPMPLDEAVIDFHDLGQAETPSGLRQKVLLVAARREMVQRVLAAVRAAGLKPEGIDLSAFAMVRALPVADAAPTLFLSVGGLTNLAITEGGVVLFTRASGSGFEGMVQVLAERRGVPLEEARQALVSIGLEGELEPGAEEEGLAARSVLAEGVRRTAADARASLDFHQNAHPGAAPVAHAVLTGSVVGVPGFASALEMELGLPVRVGVVGGARDDLEGGRFAVAAGLAVEQVAA